MTVRPIVAATLLIISWQVVATAQTTMVIEDFEFAISDEDAALGVTDLTDAANRPAFYINGDCEPLPSPCEEVAEGEFSIGTDAVFCQQFCQAGSKIGFRRLVDAVRFPNQCQEQNAAFLVNTYGDPDHPGTQSPDFPLAALKLEVAVYADGSFADGPTGSNLLINLVDCDGEVYEFHNLSEPSLYQKPWTLDVQMGRDFVGISDDSLVDGTPIGDGVLTHIVATEIFVQDDDNPPTSFGKWYVDDLRLTEPAPIGNVPAVSHWGIAILLMTITTTATIVFRT